MMKISISKKKFRESLILTWIILIWVVYLNFSCLYTNGLGKKIQLSLLLRQYLALFLNDYG